MYDMIVKTVFGSRLYGTEVESSDFDYKTVYMPKLNDIISNNVKPQFNMNLKTYNIENEVFSFYKFMELLSSGQTMAFDMVYAPEKYLEVNTPVWKKIVSIRDKFITKKMSAFCGYCRTQASKYSIKAERINAVKEVYDIVSQVDPSVKLGDIKDILPVNEYCLHTCSCDEKLGYMVCGRMAHYTVTVGYFKEILSSILHSYGKRAVDASNDNIDFKALGHAIRVAEEVKELLGDNTITFPLKNAKFIREVREGKHDYFTVIAPHIDTLLSDVEYLINASDLPEEVDKEFVNDFIVNTVKEYYEL